MTKGKTPRRKTMTTLRLTYQDVLALRPCSIDRVPSFGRRKYLTAAQALERGATIEDLLWVAAKSAARICACDLRLPVPKG